MSRREKGAAKPQEVNSDDDGIMSDQDAHDGFDDADYEEDVEGKAEAMGFQVAAASLPKRSGPTAVSKIEHCALKGGLPGG